MEVRNINNADNSAIKCAAKSHLSVTGNCNAKNNFKGAKVVTATQNGLRWVANNFSSPHQRAILGITALCTQPFIDLNNKHIKNEDKSITVAKTISKIVVGTIAGITLRHYAIKLVKKYAQSTNTGKYSQCLLPKSLVEKINRGVNIAKGHLLNYKNGLGTIIGVSCGLFTNFLIDAPLTKLLTNFIHDNYFKNSKNGGINER